MRIITTNGGAHPPDKWSNMTAQSIGDLIQIDDNSASPEAVAARKAKPRLVMDIAEALESHYADAQDEERSALKAKGDARLTEAVDPAAKTVDAMVKAIVAAAKKTPFAAHFAKTETQSVLRSIVTRDLVFAADIERSYHADANPGSETVKAYRAARAAHGSREAHLHIESYRQTV